jgi:hypothetical protein
MSSDLVVYLMLEGLLLQALLESALHPYDLNALMQSLLVRVDLQMACHLFLMLQLPPFLLPGLQQQ